MMRILFFLLVIPGLAWGQSAKKNSSLAPDSLSAKSLLEDIVVKRYSQELSTKFTPDLYSVSAEMEIRRIPEKKESTQEPISDLMLGILDPDQLTKSIAGDNGAELLATFLSQYTIESVNLAVGLQASVSAEKKVEVEKWLTERVEAEFGKKSKTVVTYIEKTTPAQDPSKTTWDYVRDYQELVGQLLLALALILGALFLGILGRPQKGTAAGGEKAPAAGQSPSLQHAQALSEEKEKQRSLAIEKRMKDEERLRKDIDTLVGQIQEIFPKASEHFDGIIRKWCQLGESGQFRLVCFSEAVSKDLGKLPIPIDAMKEVKRIFTQMPQVKLKEKKEALEKVYWDLLTVINLGIEGLAEPFSYLGSADVETVQSLLLEKNSKMRTLVALYMPERLRGEYIESLDEEKRKDLLISATELNELPASEFKSIDDQLGFQLQQKGDGEEESVRLEMTLQKIISSFKLADQIHNLKQIPQDKLLLYKQTTPNLAFLDEWPEKEMRRLMNDANSDEIANYLRILPTAEEKVIAVCPPLTAQLVKDELKRPTEMSDNDVNRLLENLLDKMVTLHELREINLQKMFSNSSESTANAA